jgi:hypothetical protein
LKLDRLLRIGLTTHLRLAGNVNAGPLTITLSQIHHSVMHLGLTMVGRLKSFVGEEISGL